MGVLLGTVAIACALVYPALLGGEVLGPEDALLFQTPFQELRPASLERPSNGLLADVYEVFHPDLLHIREALREGRLPLWDPTIAAGRPWLASQQHAAFYPLNGLAYLLPFWHSLALIAIAKLTLAAMGTFVLCRRLGLGAAAAALGAIAFGFSTYFVLWLEHPHTNIYLLLPWLLAAVLASCEAPRPRNALIVAGLVGLAALGGHPQSMLIVLTCAALFGAFELVRLRRTSDDARRAVTRAAGTLAAGLALGLAAGLVMIAPFVELLGASIDISRGGGASRPVILWGLIAPEYWGRTDWSIGELQGAPSSFFERTGYVGIIPLALAVTGLLGRRRPPRQLFFVGLLAFALVAVIDVPVGSSLLRELPAFSLINLVRMLVVVSFALAVLSAYGLQRLLDAPDKRRDALLGALALLVAVPLVVLIAGHGLLGEPAESPDARDALAGRALVRPAIIGLIALALVATLGRHIGARRMRAVLVAGLLAVTAVDLLSVGRGIHPSLDESLADLPTPPSVAFAAGQPGGERTTGAEQNDLVPNLAARFGLRDPRMHHLPVISRYSRLFTGLGGDGYSSTRTLLDGLSSTRLLDVFGVRWVIADKREQSLGLTPVFEMPGQVVLENPGALPRAWVAYDWSPANDVDAALDQVLARETEVLLRRPVVEDVAPPPSGGPRPAPTPVRPQVDGDTRVVLTVNAVAPGRLVLLDTYFPGWSAKVNGREQEIAPTLVNFRSVALEPGRNTVEFSYRPKSIIAGGAISSIAWLVILGGLVAAWIRSRRHKGGSTPPITRG